ncbi:MAG: hypothetical protein R3C59_20890 [Planctomycetaceae bacterium]
MTDIPGPKGERIPVELLGRARYGDVEETQDDKGHEGCLQWQSDDYVCHEAICPICRKGQIFGGGIFKTELRVYFQSGVARSIERPIIRMRIKCIGPPNDPPERKMTSCTVGTGDVDGLYLIPHRDPLWHRGRVKDYLRSIGSPFADHPSLESIPQ